MGDRVYTSIRFSGRITTAQAEGLIEEIKGQCCQADEGPSGDLTIEHLKLDTCFYDEQCNYAEMEGIEAYCQEHKIAYRKQWSEGGGFAAGMTVFTGDEVHECSTIDGEPAVTRAMLKQLGTGILEFFDRFDFSAPRYPPVTIVDDQQEAA